MVQPWWLGHLERPQGQAAASSASEGAGALRVLRWAYGAVVKRPPRRRSPSAAASSWPADRPTARSWDLYEEVAAAVAAAQ